MTPTYPLTYGGLPLQLLYQGKTRDTYLIPGHPWLLLIVASDRLSTHNVVHRSIISFKGHVLTALTVFWLVLMLRDIPHHLVAHGKKIYDYLPKQEYPPDLHLRAIVVRRLVIDPIEYIFRGYHAGSFEKGTRTGWQQYGGKDPYGHHLPKTLPLMTRFKTPLFTPTEKSKTDDPLNAAETKAKYPRQHDMGRSVYVRGRQLAKVRGVEIIDDKCEIGFISPDDPYYHEIPYPLMPVLADEVLTPDCARFTRLSDIQEGVDPPWLDKQLSRDMAEKMWGGTKGLPLEFSPEHCSRQSESYLDLFALLAKESLQDFQRVMNN